MQSWLVSPLDSTGKSEERGELSAIQELEKLYSIPVLSIIDMGHIITFLEQTGGSAEALEKMKEYRIRYGL